MHWLDGILIRLSVAWTADVIGEKGMDGGQLAVDIRRLRRIPPLSELETQHTDSEVTA